MNLIEKATIIHYHRNRTERYPQTVKALGWKHAQSQVKRFDEITKLADFNGSALMDVGCGTGDLKAYLDKRFTQFSYIGIDHVPEFIQSASKRFFDTPNTKFYQADFNAIASPKVDYVLASGALSYRTKESGYYFEMIAKMYAHAQKGLAFNMLDAASFTSHSLLVGHSKSDIERFCKQLSPKVYVVDDYLKDDFTIFMYR